MELHETHWQTVCIGVVFLVVGHPLIPQRCSPRRQRWHTIFKAGSNIEEGNPIFEYYAAVTRQNHDGKPKDGWYSQEAVSRLNALKMFTTWAAYGEFAEHRRGKIRPGFDADLTILSEDIINCRQDEILKTEILGTMVAGKMIYNNL